MKGAVYAYCVVSGATPAMVEGAPPGVPDASAPRLLPVAPGVDLVVSGARSRAWSEAAIAAGLRDIDWVSERALRHEAVVSYFLERLDARGAALLPLKAFTLFGSDARAIEHVRERESLVRASLDRVAGCVEWGARLRFDEQAAKAAREREAGRDKPASGAAFLARKKRIADASRSARADAIAAAARVVERLSGPARELRPVAPPEGTALVAEAAYLVPREAQGELERIAASAQHELQASGLVLELTGPWAPYHFAVEPRASEHGAAVSPRDDERLAGADR